MTASPPLTAISTLPLQRASTAAVARDARHQLAIATAGLTHRFRNGDAVLRDVALEVPTGSIYGFLGPNGAGKTTTLRLVLGLLAVQQGSVELFGRPMARHRVELLRNVGSSIESPSLYAQLAATENLRIWQVVFGCARRRIVEVLSLVGLAETGSLPAGNFSLGMKQRLSLAIALLHEPALLILDEPTNGLDPEGILEMRDLLTQLNRERGITILVSSHLLSEIERFVTHVGIINHGALVFQGTLASLVARQQAAAFTAIATGDNARALGVLAAGGWEGRLDGDRILVPPAPPDEVARMNRTLVDGGIPVHGIAAGGSDLEAIFLDLVRS